MKALCSLVFMVLCASRLLSAEDPAPQAVPPHADSLPRLLSVASGNDARPGAAALGEAVVLRIEFLQALLERSSRERSPVVLMIDGMPLRGAAPSAVNSDNGEIRFTLVSSGPARQFWDKILQTRGREHFFTQDVTVTAGLENGSMSASVASDLPNFSLVLVRRPIFFFCIAVTVFLFIIFHIVAYKSDLLRVGGAEPAEGRKPYSLSRTQMALWFFIVIISFLMLWVETGRIDTMPLSVVVLLGISAATALGAAVIDTERPGARRQERSDDFLFDILSDGNGVCIHRFQMAGWTLVLAVVFLYTVFTELRMPDFDASILFLMGISSGTYLGYKLPGRSRAVAVRS